MQASGLGIHGCLDSEELDQIELLDQMYRRRFKGCSPACDPDLLYFLGERMEYRRTWSAVSAVSNSRQSNECIVLHRASMQLVTGADRMAALGWPVSEATAMEMGASCVPSVDSKHAGTVAGSAMHLGNASLVLLIALACFGPRAAA